VKTHNDFIYHFIYKVNNYLSQKGYQAGHQ